MNENKLKSFINFIALNSKLFECDVTSHSNDYIIEKFERYINKMYLFEFPKLNITAVENNFLSMYYKKWGNPNIRGFENILIFINRANFESSTLTSTKLKTFRECIGDYELITNIYANIGIHTIIGTELSKIYEVETNFKKDFDRLVLEFNRNNKIDLIIK